MKNKAILCAIFLAIGPHAVRGQEAATPTNPAITAEEMLAPIDEALATEKITVLTDEPDIENSDFHKARKSIAEELEAISNYETRIATTSNAALKKIFEHTKNEEKEHVALLVDWLRANDPAQDAAFKKPSTEH